MIYTSLLLNGAWEMYYEPEKYEETEEPVLKVDTGGVLNAVPGYWEDMTEEFSLMPFFCNLKINPEYGLQKYPIFGTAPDMALPNIIGNFFYRRNFNLEEISGDAVIHFEGVQNDASVWINGNFIGRHEGYSTPFEMEIKKEVLKKGENTITISVSNYRLKGYSGEPVSGLTSRAANECTGGITGDVELRFYNCPIKDVAILILDDCKSAKVEIIKTEEALFKWELFDGDILLKKGESKGDFSFDTENMDRWSPENPKLYILKVICRDCMIERKFGIRSLKADGVDFKLNGMPYYLRGICEHCYFPETIHPNHDYVYYRSIIKNIKKLGFNFIRFHTYIPEEEYMQAADELGVILHVECPNNTTVREWKEIVDFCRRHTSVLIYCCGNELQVDEPFIEHLRACACVVHQKTDALFSPMNALRGLEYLFFIEPELSHELIDEPFEHNPRRFKLLGEFSDMYSSYANGLFSYYSDTADCEKVDARASVYKKPRVSHEICIDGTYTDLSLKDRYKGLRVGKTEMFSSLENHMREKGVLKKAPLYFKNSSEWQRRIRKRCFEDIRRCKTLAGYDFLGPIDTHWHTFGYDVGMMNEFYELKPGETVKNVLMYNSPTVILADLKKKYNYFSGEKVSIELFVSHFGKNDIKNGEVTVRLFENGNVIKCDEISGLEAKNGDVSKISDYSLTMPETEKPMALKLHVTLSANGIYAENEWEIYVFPKADIPKTDIVITETDNAEELIALLKSGKKVLVKGKGPFASKPTTFRIGLAGRTEGNLATVVSDHPSLGDFPHEGFCGFQFVDLMNDGNAVCFESDDIPFEPIVEVVSTHKYIIRQAAVFEANVLDGKLFVASFDFKESDPAANWLLSQFVSYMESESFNPVISLDEEQIYALANAEIKKAEGNKNLAFNANDKTSTRKKFLKDKDK